MFNTNKSKFCADTCSYCQNDVRPLGCDVYPKCKKVKGRNRQILLGLLILLLVLLTPTYAVSSADGSSSDGSLLQLLLTLGSLGSLLIGAFIYISNQITNSKKDTLILLKELENEIKTEHRNRLKEQDIDIRDLKKEIDNNKTIDEVRNQRNTKNFIKVYENLNKVIRVVEVLQIEIDLNAQHIEDLFAANNMTKRKNPRLPSKLREVDPHENLDDLVSFDSGFFDHQQD